MRTPPKRGVSCRDPPPKQIFLADPRHGLGTADPDKIDLVKIGWEEGILI